MLLSSHHCQEYSWLPPIPHCNLWLPSQPAIPRLQPSLHPGKYQIDNRMCPKGLQWRTFPVSPYTRDYHGSPIYYRLLAEERQISGSDGIGRTTEEKIDVHFGEMVFDGVKDRSRHHLEDLNQARHCRHKHFNHILHNCFHCNHDVSTPERKIQFLPLSAGQIGARLIHILCLFSNQLLT
jgi:hypothetical protein